jgi:hypothetical protein
VAGVTAWVGLDLSGQKSSVLGWLGGIDCNHCGGCIVGVMRAVMGVGAVLKCWAQSLR